MGNLIKNPKKIFTSGSGSSGGGGGSFVPYSGATGPIDLNNVTLTNVKTLGLNAATTSSTPLQFTPSATIPSSPTSGSIWYDTVYGLTIYDSAASADAFTVTNGTIRTTLSYVASQGGFIGTSSNHNLTLMTNDAVGVGYGATLWTNGGFKINPNAAVTPTAMLTIQPGVLTNLVELKTAGEAGNLWVVSNQGNTAITPSISTSGAVSTLTITPSSNTNQTASTEISSVKYNSFTRQWATGTITTQREVYLNTPTYSAVGASVFTNVYGLYVNAPIAGTNVTITNNWAAGFNGNVEITNGALTSRIKVRVTTITSSATPTINTDVCDAVTITALATDITSFTTNLTGTPNNFDQLTIRIKDDGTARTLTFGSSFSAGGVALPTTTVISTVITIGFIYDSVTSKWRCEAVS